MSTLLDLIHGVSILMLAIASIFTTRRMTRFEREFQRSAPAAHDSSIEGGHNA